MIIQDAPFEVFNLTTSAPVEHAGERGAAFWRTVQRGNVRVRLVEYSPGYEADHWCEKGHAVYVLKGSFDSLLKDGRTFHLTAGMGYLVADHAEAHRSSTTEGVTLLIVD